MNIRISLMALLAISVAQPSLIMGQQAADQSLIQAVRSGNSASVDQAIAQGANLNAKDSSFGQTPVMWAAILGNKDIATKLLDAGADANAQNKEGATALILASTVDKDIVKALLQHGADVNITNKMNMTPLMFAAFAGNKEIVNLLLDANAEINAQDKLLRTALIHAAMHNKPEIVEILVRRGADDKFKDSKGMSAKDHARQQNRSNIVNLIP